MEENSNIEIKPVRTDFSNQEIGPWAIKRYIHHLNNNPMWLAKCVYCEEEIVSTIPKIRKRTECGCESTLNFRYGIFITNNIYCWYSDKAKEEAESFSLKPADIIKLYIKQGGVDSEGNKLIFDYYWNYSVDPPTCNFIWPNLERISKTSGYHFKNCYLVANNEQRFPRKRANLISKYNKTHSIKII